jgi:hypothetical protein
VGGIDTLAIEWDVPKAAQSRAFHSTPAPWSDEGRLRIYVASQLGFVLPQIEFVDADGRVATRFSAEDFKQVGAGLFFPRLCQYRTFPDRNRPGHYLQYEILQVKDVNEEIPEEAFVVDVPAGTFVSDHRGSEVVHFELADLPGFTLETALEKVDRDRQHERARRWRQFLLRAILIGANVFLIGIVIVGLTMRGRRTSTS